MLVQSHLGRIDLLPAADGYGSPVRDPELGAAAVRLARVDPRLGMIAARGVREPETRARAISGMAALVASLDTAVLIPACREALAQFGDEARPAFLLSLTALEPVVAALGPAVRDKTWLAVRDVARWWP